MEVKDYDGWIIYANGEYLMAVAYEDTKMCRRSNSPFNAAFFKDVNDAMKVARRVGGQVRRFNSITGRVET